MAVVAPDCDRPRMPRRAGSDLTRTVSERIRTRRTALGWTQEQLAEASGVQATTISRIERGKIAPSLGALHELATALRTSMGDLVGDPVGEDADESRVLEAWRGTDREVRSAFLELLAAVEKTRR